MSLSVLPTGRRRSTAQLATDEGLCLATVRRYVHFGVLATNGARVRLRAVRIGGKLWVYDLDWVAFVHALNADRVEAAP